MYVRLAFAVAAHLESEILIVDEVLAVGDAEFQKKCLGKMGDVSKGEGRTVLFVSHELNAVSQICDTGILLNKGLVEYKGAIRETVSTYLNSNNDSVIYLNEKDNSAKPMFIQEIQVLKTNGEVSKEYLYNEPINFKFTLGINEKIKDTSFFVTILDSRKRRVFSCEREFVDETMTLSIEPNTLVRGNYSIHAFINQPKVAQLDVAEDVCKFTVIDPGSYLSKHGEYDYGSVFGRYVWD